MTNSVEVFIIVGGKSFTVDQFLAFRQQVGTLRSNASNLDKKLKTELNRAYKYFSDVTDALVAKSVGASQITALAGRGFQADFVSIEGDISEAKTVTVKLTESGALRSNKIKLGNIALSSIQNIATRGVEATDTGYIQASESFAISADDKSSFINNLISRSSEERKKYLNSLSSEDSSYGRAAKQIITNIEVKSSKIYVSAPNSSGKSTIRQIGWTWKDILNNPAASIKVSKNGDLDVEFNEKLVSDALNNATNTTEYKNLTESFAKEINDIIEKAQFTKEIFTALNNYNLTFDKLVKWEKGSVKVYQAKILQKNTNRTSSKTSAQKTISDAQFTALVQKDVETKMPKGPLRGPPLSPTVLTYRTGTFVDSIRVIQDLRQKLMTYYYAPNYKIHERKGARAPRFLLQSSIRATVQQVYSEKFRIIRGF
jgi:hypothetical protein